MTVNIVGYDKSRGTREGLATVSGALAYDEPHHRLDNYVGCPSGHPCPNKEQQPLVDLDE